MRLMSTFFFFRSSCSSSAATHGGMRLQQSLSLACWTFNGIALAFAQIWGTCYIYIYIILYLSIWSHLIKSNVLLIEDIKGTLVFVDVVWDLMGPSQSIQAAAGCKSSMGCPSVTTACWENDMVNIGKHWWSKKPANKYTNGQYGILFCFLFYIFNLIPFW